MRSFPRRAGFRLPIILGIALAMLFSPMTLGLPRALAQSALYPGATGLIANSGGEPVVLRDAPGFDGAAVSTFPEGTPAEITEGPVYSADGSAWLGVAIGGMTGYMLADYLVDSGESAAPVADETTEDATAAEPLASEPAAESAPAESLAALPANPVATADLNLRAGPTYNDMVLAVIPAGTALTTTGDWSAGFAGVTYNGQFGWVDSSWLGEGAAPEAPTDDVTLLQEAAPASTETPTDDSALVSDLIAPAGTTAQAIDVANLRLGPSEGDEVLRVLPAGAIVTATGEPSEGWTPVWYNGTWGFIRADLLSTDTAANSVSLAQNAAPAEEAPDGDSTALLATTLDEVNLRSDPDMSASIVDTIPAGVALTPLAGPQSGFYQVEYDGQTGWVAADYLQVAASYFQKDDKSDHGKVEGSEPARNAGSGGIIWPVRGGTWSILQGYNGSSHQNEDGLWQYYYSLDLQREDGNTAGQTIYAPVNGTVTWTDPSTGGISIDMGDGHAVAMFHVTFDGAFQAGTKVSQGDPMGQISGPGGPGFAETPHVHFTLWASDDHGNWDRHAEPFTGKYSISGMDFPDVGGSSEYEGTEFHP
jgi:uncharacterized protein YraI